MDEIDSIQNKFVSLIHKVLPLNAIPLDVQSLTSELSQHLNKLVRSVSDLQTAADTEIKKWRSLYKKHKKPRTTILQESWQELTKMYDKSHT